MAALLLASPHERLTGSLPPAVLLDARKVLRRLHREADALLVVLETKGQILDYVGDERFCPRNLLLLAPAMPGVERVGLRDETQGKVASVRVRLLRGWPSLGLHIVEPSDPAMEVMGELLQRAAEELEDVIIPHLGGAARG